MPDGYAVELYFDPALENQVLKIWNVLARRQVSTQLIDNEERPHITVFSTPMLEPSKLHSLIKNFAAKQRPLSVTLATVGSFSTDENVLFLAPTPTAALLTFHEQICDMFRREGLDIGQSYQPDSWFPHCAVALNVVKSRMGEAFSMLREFKLPLTGHVYDIGLVEYHPVREHYAFPLGGENK
ncbi:hypothetical protein KP509_10G019100 [Ceratopteris richardii]|uniref:RNA ligase/cyclic nucleotide phosphodiesterase family protein n=1 Tax=Ceratopteris richardii TaxID=49495 RepID=A0A8T2TZ43_CERRI|nr:hypothetical protein KP509_10G019100 [Ceratopteris richardii]